MYIVSLSTITFSTKNLKRYCQIKIIPIHFFYFYISTVKGRIELSSIGLLKNCCRCSVNKYATYPAENIHLKV
jgi:hypothetical protein